MKKGPVWAAAAGLDYSHCKHTFTTQNYEIYAELFMREICNNKLRNTSKLHIQNMINM